MSLTCISAGRFEDDVAELYESSFSEIEKVPISNMERAMKGGAVLDVFREGEALIGFTYSFIFGDRLFFIYFATSPEVRGRGYGGRILRAVREKYSDKRMFLIAEPEDRDAPDSGMRARRQRFYLRNGCEGTGLRILSDGAWFDSMFMQGTLTDREMVDTVRRYEDIHNGRIRCGRATHRHFSAADRVREDFKSTSFLPGCEYSLRLGGFSGVHYRDIHLHRASDQWFLHVSPVYR